MIAPTQANTPLAGKLLSRPFLQTAMEARLIDALEWALTNANHSDHPHYPYLLESGRWAYPYLVNGSPMGGGVGEANFDTALEAVEAAQTQPA